MQVYGPKRLRDARSSAGLNFADEPASVTDTPDTAAARPLLGPIDAGWLFLIAGLALLSAAVLIPAEQDLADARWRRDLALAHETNRLERLERYRAYLDALERNDAEVIESLAASQLNLVRADAQLVDAATQPAAFNASVFSQLEPGNVTVTAPPEHRSTLARLVTSRRTRLWVIGFAALCVLIGSLPPAIVGRRSQSSEP